MPPPPSHFPSCGQAILIRPHLSTSDDGVSPFDDDPSQSLSVNGGSPPGPTCPWTGTVSHQKGTARKSLKGLELRPNMLQQHDRKRTMGLHHMLQVAQNKRLTDLARALH